MMLKYGITLLVFFHVSCISAEAIYFDEFKNYTKLDDSGTESNTGTNECSQEIILLCLKQNISGYIDSVFADEFDNITLFGGITLTTNDLEDNNNKRKRFLEHGTTNFSGIQLIMKCTTCQEKNAEVTKYISALAEVISEVKTKAVDYFATRDYQIQLPQLFFHGTRFEISPTEIDQNGILFEIHSKNGILSSQGRLFFKKIRKYIQNRLLVALFTVLLIIKLIKLKMFIIVPFLFGVGAAKKLFLKLLLLIVPAFAHVFKLCSSYYSTHATKFHHHHHQIAHHHHHVPVPVPVPVLESYYEDKFSSSYIPESEFAGYRYSHPHIEQRMDNEKAMEWDNKQYVSYYGENDPNTSYSHERNLFQQPSTKHYAALESFSNSDTKMLTKHKMPSSLYDITSRIGNKMNSNYNIHSTKLNINDKKRIPVINIKPTNLKRGHMASPNPDILQVTSKDKTSFDLSKQPVSNMQMDSLEHTPVLFGVAHKNHDNLYGQILDRIEFIFNQYQLFDEICRMRLVCNMYSNPKIYEPFSNIMSNELSSGIDDIDKRNHDTVFIRLYRQYIDAARLGQDGGECAKVFQCHDDRHDVY